MVINAASGSLELFSHRGEEAAFLKQLLASIPEVIVAVDASKLGRRHPWSFAAAPALAGKSVTLVADTLSSDQRESLESLITAARRTGCRFSYEEAPPMANAPEA